MRKIDGKFHVEGDKIVKTTNGQEVPEDEPLFLLRARDKLAIPMLDHYRFLCKMEGCTDYQMDGIDAAIRKFEDFAGTQPDKMKQPGATLGK